MKHKEIDYKPNRCVSFWNSNGFISYIVIALLTIIIVLLLAALFFSPETVTKFRQSTFGTSDSQQTSQTGKNGGQSDPAAVNGQPIELSEADPDKHALQTTDPSRQDDSVNGADAGADTGQKASDAVNDELAANINSFFATLDTRDYIRDFQLDSPSHVYFPKLIQNLINNPPIVSGETDDLFTILQNTAHFFRILGKKNILVLKGILDRERDTFEQTLADFYQLTDDPDTLEEHFNLTIGQEELYAYAGFFLNTMGGRLYLFRRDSMSRMVVSYYAILIIEQANLEGRNTYGIEIKDAIDNLIIEIESSRIKLKMRDEYLDTLYDLKVKYQ